MISPLQAIYRNAPLIAVQYEYVCICSTIG